MTLYKRNKTWHTDFFVDGQRYRQSLHTTKYREAQKEQTKLIRERKKLLKKRENSKKSKGAK